MNLRIYPTKLRGVIGAIPSKSMAHRILICSALSKKETKVHCRQTSGDIEATACCLTALGASVRTDSPGCCRVLPVGRQIDQLLPCGESGTTLRLLLPVAAALGRAVTFGMDGRLPYRPLSPLEEELGRHGVSFHRPGPQTLTVSGKLQPGAYTLPGDVSSQFISGLLLALPLLGAESTLTVTGKTESAPYIHMTLQVLEDFGVRIRQQGNQYHISPSSYESPGEAVVEGDWSNSAFWLAATAMGSRLEVTGLNENSPQGDKSVVRTLQNLGSGKEIDVSHIPDLVPVLAVAATTATGTTHFVHAGRLRLKESDRIASVAALIRNLGGQILETGDSLSVTGSLLSGGTVDAVGDHRIAMAAAVAATVCENPVLLRGANAVQKSYPDFWKDYRSLGGIIEEVLP